MSPTHFSRLGALGLLGLGVGLSFAIGSWPGCTIYDSSLILPGDAGGGPGGDAGSSCGVHWPGVPDRDDDSGSNDFHTVFAMQVIDIGVGPDSGPLGPTVDAALAPFGFDLDNDCTCPGPASCLQAPGTAKICDDNAGRDHIALKLFRDLGASAQAGSVSANQSMQAGQFGILLQITGYNGTQNDRQVSVALYASNGIVGVQDGGATPNHDGNDRWTVDPAYVSNAQTLDPSVDCDNNPACIPNYEDPNAYVAGGILVANLASVPLTFGYRANIGGAVMKLYDMHIVGPITGLRLDNGTITGRWRTGDLLGNMATIPDPLVDGGYVCGDSGLYHFFKPVICALQDIASSPNGDNKNLNCDALSMGFSFQAETARLGPVYGVAAPSAGCRQNGSPFTDTCP